MTAADRPSVPQVGDIITTADQLDALPVGSVVLHDSDVDPPGIAVMQRSVHTGAWYLPAAVQRVEPLLPVTVLFVPSRPVATCGHPNHGADDHDCAPFLPSVTDNARAAVRGAAMDLYRALRRANPDAYAEVEEVENWAYWEDIVRTAQVTLAAGRAETATATTEDVARVLGEHTLTGAATRVKCRCGWKPDFGREPFVGWIAQYDQHRAQALADAGLLAAARTRPTREQIAAVIHHDGWEVPEGYAGSIQPDACTTCRKSLAIADRILALLEGGDPR